jgi:hypothetical protein
MRSIRVAAGVASLFLLLLVLLFPNPSRAAQSVNGTAHLSLTRVSGGVPNMHAALNRIQAREISILDSFEGPVELAAGEKAFFHAGWFLALYKDCDDAVLASDPESPFVDPDSGLGPCEFIKTIFPLDVATTNVEARAILNSIDIQVTFDGEVLSHVAKVVKPFEFDNRPDGEAVACQQFAYDEFLFSVLADFDYLDPSGKTQFDTCYGKDVAVPIPQKLLSAGTHEGAFRYFLDGDPFFEFPVEIIVE